MRFYRIKDDWLTYLEGDVLSDTLDVLTGLSLARLQKYPPPKIGGLPFGVETRVLGRYLTNKSAQLDASALSNIYRSFASPEDKLHYRAFRQNDKLTRAEWSEIIGAERVGKWVEYRFLRVDGEFFICQFSIVAIDGLIFMIDPMNDHGNPIECVVLDGDYSEKDISDEIQPFYHTYMGLDSLQMIANMDEQALPDGGRYLDCGPGSGGILLYFSRRFDEAVGIDLNPRAAKVAGINARLNGLKNVHCQFDDALELGDRYGRFDLISWNLPFLFLPDDAADEAMDAFGGDMGIGLCLDFIDRLPGLITERGLVCLAAVAPFLETGENVLEERLKEKLPALKLDCTVKVNQASFAHTRDVWHFHQRSGIKKFEAVYLYLTRGTGKLTRIEASAGRKAVDKLREKMYQRKFA